jgi:hypothetical protein
MRWGSTTTRRDPLRRGRRGVAVLLPGVVGLLAAAVMSATAATTPPPSTLSANGALGSGQYLLSPDGHFRVLMQSDGDLVESILGGRATWSTGTDKAAGARAVMQVNGNLVIYDPTNTAVWSSNSPTVGCPRLVLQNDGNLVIYGDTAAPWSAASRLNKMLKGDVLKAGWSIYSEAPEAYRLTMFADGNLALLDGSGKELWSAKTYGHPGDYASMQTDGNLVVYDKTGHALWSSATNGNPGAYLEMLGDGNVDIIAPGGTVLWRSHTYHDGSGVSLAPKAPAPVICPAPQPPAPPVTTTTTTTAPVVTVPVPTPIPTPKPQPRALRIKLTISWTWDRATTRVHKVTVGSFPYRTTLQVRCTGRGCPRHRGKNTATGIRGVHSLLHALVGRRYRAGTKVLITLQAPGYRQERAELDMRWGRKPNVRLLR